MNITTQLYEALKGGYKWMCQWNDESAKANKLALAALAAYESLPVVDEREGFERWVRSTGAKIDLAWTDTPVSTYLKVETRGMLAAWQARAARPPAVPIDDDAGEETLVDAVAAYRTDHRQSPPTDKDCLTAGAAGRRENTDFTKYRQISPNEYVEKEVAKSDVPRAATPQPISNSYALPEGYALVPLTPTADMLDAAQQRDCDGKPASYTTIYMAMIAEARKTAPPADARGG